jgi:ATP-dependent RNA helicase DDX55/SPB4
MNVFIEFFIFFKDWTFSNFNVLVFDEADRLLVQRASFETQLSSILKILPKQRLTLLVSATLSNELIMLLKAGIRNPVLVRIESTASTTTPNSTFTSSNTLCETTNNENNEQNINQPCHATPDHLTNFYCVLRRYSKVSFLLKFLIAHVLPGDKNKKGKKCIIFFLTCYYAHYFYKLFSKLKEMYSGVFNAKLFCLNGKMSAKSRISETLRFRKVQEDNSCAILFATDVAARGLDFPDVSWIVQYDPPTV